MVSPTSTSDTAAGASWSGECIISEGEISVTTNNKTDNVEVLQSNGTIDSNSPVMRITLESNTEYRIRFGYKFYSISNENDVVSYGVTISGDENNESPYLEIVSDDTTMAGVYTYDDVMITTESATVYDIYVNDVFGATFDLMEISVRKN